MTDNKNIEIQKEALRRLSENYRIEVNTDEIDERLEALAQHVGRQLSEDEQGWVLDIVDEFMPKDTQGNYTIPLMDFVKAWEIHLARERDGVPHIENLRGEVPVC